MPTPLIAGNWKMNKTASEAAVFVRELLPLLPSPPQVAVLLAPPFTALAAVAHELRQAPGVTLGAQDVFWEDKGAYTGEVSAPMLVDIGCRYVIIGHSERRRHFGETDDTVNRKVQAALRHGLRPVVCLGESLAQREGGETRKVVTRQLDGALRDIPPLGERVVLAYEPVWAIGTGRAATPEQAREVHGWLRGVLEERWGAEAAAQVRILYGGSVTAENAEGFLAQADVDGALVGGACLIPKSFATIVTLAVGAR